MSPRAAPDWPAPTSRCAAARRSCPPAPGPACTCCTAAGPWWGWRSAFGPPPRPRGRHPPAAPPSALHAAAGVIRDYAALMKPRIIMLLLITTATTMLIAAPHRVGLGVLLLTLLGGTLAAGSANAFNMYIDRDIDALMRRTEERRVGKECRSRWSPDH